MPCETDILMPCGKKYYCKKTSCRHSDLCKSLREGIYYQKNIHTNMSAPTASNKKKPLAIPSDIVYTYDGSLAGFYSCVHESVYTHEIPMHIWSESKMQPSFFSTKHIVTDTEKSHKVELSLSKKISPRAQELIETTFLSCLHEKELAMLRFLLLGYQIGAPACYLFGHNDVQPILSAVKHLHGEAHLLKGFIRFSDYDGVLAATITPKNFVLPFLQHHFIARYREESFLIHDKTHKAALIYENRQARIIPLENIAFPTASEAEENYRRLWKQFYNTIAIKARENPRCRMSMMPKRYWENMLEVSDLLT